MKKYLIENAGYVHLTLFILWSFPLFATFCCGTAMFNEAVWIPLMALIALLLQLCFAIVETDWVQDIQKKSGYGEH